MRETEQGDIIMAGVTPGSMWPKSSWLTCSVRLTRIAHAREAAHKLEAFGAVQASYQR
jgi:hypothetical protein